MADGLLTMFGKTYNTVGSADSNLLLQTRGDLKIRWGNKFIDLIKNGKINVESEFLFKVESKEDIVNDGIYYIKGEESDEIWVKIKDNLINVVGEINDNYVAFVKDQEVKGDSKFRALKNIGFYQENLEKAKSIEFTEGLVYILDEHQLYYYQDGQLLRYEQKFEIPNPLQLDAITIDGTDSTISGVSSLSLNAGGNPYIKLENQISLYKNILIDGNIYHKTFNGNKGFGMYIADNLSIIEADIIIARNQIKIKNTSEVTYSLLMSLILSDSLEVGRKYTITDFFEDWYNYDVTKDGITTSTQFYFPITIEAKTTNQLEKEGYYCGNPNWIVEYSTESSFLGTFTFNKITTTEEGNTYTETVTEDVYTNGKILKLTDEYGNSANFDFKHKMFKYGTDSDDKTLWKYAFNMAKPTMNSVELLNLLNYDYLIDYYNVHSSCDASLFGKVTNMHINKEEDDSISSETLQQKGMIVFTDCEHRETHDSIINTSTGNYIINVPFYDNIITGIFNPSGTFEFNQNFHGNTIGNIYLSGNKEDSTAEDTVNMDNVTITDSYFSDITNSTLEGTINSSKFLKDVTKLSFNGIINRCVFNEEVNDVTITSEISDSEFAKLSNGIEVEGSFSNVKIVDNITPASAEYVQNLIGSNYTSIATLKVSTDVVPRLVNTGTKECSIKVLKNKKIFYVKNGTVVEDTSPRGVIVMFSGTIQDIPEGWAICDGDVHDGVVTPDLRGRFIRSISAGESVGPKDNSDLETNGNGTRQAYLKKTIKHTHTFKTYNTNLTADTSNFNVGYANGASLTIDTSNLGVTIDSLTLYQTCYYEQYGTHLINDIVKDANVPNSTWIGTELSSTGLEHNHTGSITGTASGNLPAIQVSGSITVPINYTPEQETTETGFVDAVNVEPLAYALIFIMKL